MVVPCFDMNRIRALEKESQHLLDKADECFRNHDLVGALKYRMSLDQYLLSYQYHWGRGGSGAGSFWSICGAVVARYGNDAAYAMIWNADWCDEEMSGGWPSSALSGFYGAINHQYHEEGFKNSYGGGFHYYLIEDHKSFQDYSRSSCHCCPTAWTADGAGLWRGHQTGNELMRQIKLFESDELTGWPTVHVFIKTGDVRGILTVNSSAETERMGCLWHFYSEDYGGLQSSTSLADVVKNGYFTAEMPLRGGRFKALCSNERIVATLKDYLEGGQTKQKEDRGRLRILNDADTAKIYDQFSIPRYTLVHKSTIV